MTSARLNMTVENATDATANGVTWQSLGVFPFDAGSEVRVIRDASAGGYVVADGIRLVFDSMIARGTVVTIN